MTPHLSELFNQNNATFFLLQADWPVPTCLFEWWPVMFSLVEGCSLSQQHTVNTGHNILTKYDTHHAFYAFQTNSVFKNR